MDPFSSNTPKLKAGIKKIIKIKKKVRLIIEDDDTVSKPSIDVSRISKPRLELSPPKSDIRVDTRTEGKFDSTSDDVFSEAKSFDVLEIGSKIDSKREDKKEFVISDVKINYTSENTLFKIGEFLQRDYESLQTSIDAIPKSTRVTFYNVCHTICYDSKSPYLLYYLFKYPKSDNPSSDLMIFPFKSYKHMSTSGKSLVTQSKELIRSLFTRTLRANIIDEPIGYKFDKETNSVFIFYNFTYNADLFKPTLSERKQQFWWCLVDEMVNYKKVLNFPVSKIVYNLISENEQMIYLYYKNESGVISKIETPSVGYHGTYYDLLPLIVSFGLKPSTLYPMMGPYYYFGTFRKAVRYAGWTSTYKPRKIGDKFIADENGLYEKGGIVRFALFLGKMKAFLNLPYDDDDYSDRYYNRIKLNPRDKEYEDLTLKLHDHDGKWVEEYDSVYVGRSKLANGGLFMKNPEFITRDFDQQHILTYHELDKTTLVYDSRRQKIKWDPNYENYHIK